MASSNQNQEADYLIDGKPFMLARKTGGRAWSRAGIADVPSRRSVSDQRYGNVPDVLDHPEVYDDWSGGVTEPYADSGKSNGYAWSNGYDARFPRKLIHSQAPQLLAAAYSSLGSNVEGFIDVPLQGGVSKRGAGTVLVIGTKLVGMLTPTDYQNTAGSAFRIATILARDYRYPAAIFGSYAYVGARSDGFLRVDVSGAATLGPEGAGWFVVGGQRMWWPLVLGGGAGVLSNQFRSLSLEQDILATANYAASLPLGRGLAPQTAVAYQDQIYLGFPDGIYEGNLSGTFHNILTDIGAPVDTDNFRDLTIHNGQIVGPEGRHIWAYKPSTIESRTREIGPPLGALPVASGNTPLSGKFTCVEAFGQWLYAGLFTGSQSWFLAGYDASGPALPYVWHPLHNFLGLTTKIHRIHVDGITSSSGGVSIPNRIWCATDGSFGAMAGATAPVFYWPIPSGDGNPAADLGFSPNYMGSAAMDMVTSDWGAPATPKAWRSAELEVDNIADWTLGAGPQLGRGFIYSVLDGSLPMAPVGTIQNSPRGVVYFPSTTGSMALGQRVVMHIETWARAGNNVSPIVHSLVVRGLLRPQSIEVITAKTRIADNMRNRRQTPMRPARQQITDLRTFAAGSAPRVLTDLAGAQQFVSVIPPIEEEEFWQEGDDNPEVIATVKMAVMTYTSNPNLTGYQ